MHRSGPKTSPVSALLTSVLSLVLALAPTALVNAAAPSDIKKDMRLSQRPAIYPPECTTPKPYHINHWWPDANRFSIALSPARDIAAADALRLSEKYKVEFEGASLHTDGHYHVSVAWLEPDQVAALRCEESVYEIGFAALTLIYSQTDTPFTIVVRVSEDAHTCTVATAETPCSRLPDYLRQTLKVPPSQPVYLQETASSREEGSLKALSDSLRNAGYQSVTTGEFISEP